MGYIDHLKEDLYEFCIVISGANIIRMAMVYFGMETAKDSPVLFKVDELPWCVLGVALVSLGSYIWKRTRKPSKEKNYETEFYL